MVVYTEVGEKSVAIFSPVAGLTMYPFIGSDIVISLLAGLFSQAVWEARWQMGKTINAITNLATLKSKTITIYLN
ncbi:hypothetical protein CEQ90_13345 [Lewinellaceae bacterium SD302]|nr:hypothetical protein CEQ90_13345 [Lewinellaceae bacterium SD302]